MVGQRVSAVRPDDIRQHNLSLVLHHLHRDGALTRAELTQRLQLSRSTVKALGADLAQLGLVEEVVPSGGERVSIEDCPYSGAASYYTVDPGGESLVISQ